MGNDVQLKCRLCSQEHRPIRLAPGEKAFCARCGTMMAKERRYGADGALAFAVTGLILAVPAMLLPFITATKLGDQRESLIFTGVAALWNYGMRAMAVLVVLCGALLPVALLGSLAVLHAPARLGLRALNHRLLFRAAHFVEHWAFPEVQVLAVFVALMRLGSLVDVRIGPGFWCYCAMAVFLVLAQRSFDFASAEVPSASGAPDLRAAP